MLTNQDLDAHEWRLPALWDLGVVDEMRVPGLCTFGGKSNVMLRMCTIRVVLMYKAVMYKSTTTAWMRITVAFEVDGTIGTDAQHMDIDERRAASASD